jgi:hypothetical protein
MHIFKNNNSKSEFFRFFKDYFNENHFFINYAYYLIIIIQKLNKIIKIF